MNNMRNFKYDLGMVLAIYGSTAMSIIYIAIVFVLPIDEINMNFVKYAFPVSFFASLIGVYLMTKYPMYNE